MTASKPLDAYAGQYENTPYGTVTVTNVNGELVLQWSRMTLPLEHLQYDTFSAYSEWDGVDENVVFRMGDDWTVNELTIFGQRFLRKR